MAETTSSGGFMSGVTDIFGSVLNNSSGIADVIKATKSTNAQTQTPNLQYDQYGRLPGQAGYGTATPPATGVQSTGFSSLSTGLKIAIAAGVAVVGFVVYKLLKRKR